MTAVLQALFLMLTILAAGSAMAESRESKSVMIAVRPAVQLSSAEGLNRELSLAELVDLKAVREQDRAEVERHLRQVALTDRPAVGEERLFTQEGLEPIVAEAERRLAAAGFSSDWKVPRRSRVFRNSSFTANEIERALRAELQKKCEDCEVQIRSLELPAEAKRLIRIQADVGEAQHVRDWTIVGRNERPRGSFAWPLQVDLTNGTRRSMMISGTVEFYRTVPVLTRAVQGGEKISSEDRRMERRNVSFASDEPATSSDLDIGVAARNFSSGEPVWRSSLRKEQVVRYGDIVRVQAGDEAFTITTEGVALSAAAIGETVQVRVGKLKKQISGVLKERGLVEIR